MSIDSINFSTKTPAFKGNYKRTEQGNPYYHTNSAMKIGGTLAGLCALGTAIDLAGNNFFQKALKNLPEADKDLIKINNKTAILANGLAALAIHLGCAAFIDHKRNEKAKETLKEVYEALVEKGYNPINQIVGYILSGDPTYITSHNNARSLIMKAERDELVEEVVRYFIEGKGL